MPGIAPATFAKAVAAPAHLHVSVANPVALSHILVPYCHPHSAGMRSYKELSRTLRAYLNLPHNIPYPIFMTKPEWWWRTLSCVPHLMALQISDTAFYFVPLMQRHEQFEFLTYYVPGAIQRLPSWFLMVYCVAIYVGVVRNSKLPHYFRHHMMMGLVLKNCIQITWYASNFLHLIHYNRTFGMYYWAGVGLMSILLLLEARPCR